MPIVFALIAGVLFGAGLSIADMVNPARVLNFLDLAGGWDPTLIFVMGGGLAVTFIGYRLAFRRGKPIADARFHLPPKRKIDAWLVGGSAVFGLGWGLGGICPGPAFADIVSLDPKIFLFIAAMLTGMIAARLVVNAASGKNPA